MKDIIQVNSKGKTEHLFIDNISLIRIEYSKQDKSLEYSPAVTKRYWIPWFNYTNIEGWFEYKGHSLFEYFYTKGEIQKAGYQIKGTEVWTRNAIQFFLNNGNCHVVKFTDNQMDDFNKLVGELESLVNVKIKIDK